MLKSDYLFDQVCADASTRRMWHFTGYELKFVLAWQNDELNHLSFNIPQGNLLSLPLTFQQASECLASDREQNSASDSLAGPEMKSLGDI